MRDSDIACPRCGSTRKDFDTDNLDDLFAFEWDEPCRFVYKREWTCEECGCFFVSEHPFDISYGGTYEI